MKCSYSIDYIFFRSDLPILCSVCESVALNDQSSIKKTMSYYYSSELPTFSQMVKDYIPYNYADYSYDAYYNQYNTYNYYYTRYNSNYTSHLYDNSMQSESRDSKSDNEKTRNEEKEKVARYLIDFSKHSS